MVRPLPYLFVGCEGHAHFAVFDFGVLYQKFHGVHYLGNAGFVVGTEQRAPVGYNQILPNVV